eukprot:EG_transcript_24759
MAGKAVVMEDWINPELQGTGGNRSDDEDDEFVHTSQSECRVEEAGEAAGSDQPEGGGEALLSESAAEKLVRQLEYYLGDENLPIDFSILDQADERCWIPMTFMLRGFKVQRLFSEAQVEDPMAFSQAAIQEHSRLLVCRLVGDELKVRRRAQLPPPLLDVAKATLIRGPLVPGPATSKGAGPAVGRGGGRGQGPSGGKGKGPGPKGKGTTAYGGSSYSYGYGYGSGPSGGGWYGGGR